LDHPDVRRVGGCAWHHEREAISDYKSEAYADINETLRYGDLADDIEGETKALVYALDSALSIFQLPEPVIAWRGFVSEVLVANADSLPGDVISDAAFFSTTLLRATAEKFIEADPDEAALLAEVAIPGGLTVGAYVGAPDAVKYLGEAEILLPRGSRFHVDAVRHDTNDLILELEALP